MFSVIATPTTTYLTNSLPLISNLKAAVSPLQIVEIITDYSSHYPSRGLNLKAIRNQERSSSRHPSIAEMESSGKHAAERYAVVTGSNRGIGLETVRQLASQGVKVVLTARNEKRGMEALQSLHESGLTNVVFHQLDVLDPVSINSLANFIQEKFGRLDILVNNAGVSGVVVDEEGLKALNIDPSAWLSGEAYKLIELHGVIKTNYEKAEECLNINYYGVKRVTEALLPLLQLSPAGARIVNVSSLRSELKGKYEQMYEQSEEFQQELKLKVREILTEQEWRRRKMQMRISEEQGRLKKDEEEAKEMWKRKREHEEQWEGTREQRVSSWRDFMKSGKKAKKGEIRPPKLKTEDPNKSYVQRPVKRG